VDLLDDHVAIDLARAGPHEGIADVYELVRAAIRKGCALRCRYESIERSVNGRADGDEFLFQPYTLFFSQRAWYAVGHHGHRGEVRCLKLNRFSSIAITGERYTIPRDFTLANHLGNAWRMIRGKKSYNVELHFDAGFAETIADTHWHPTQKIEWLDDGAILFRCTVDGLDEILWWVLSMGPHCCVIEPPELIERVRELANKMVSRYDSYTSRGQ